jgi:hypothetical protein
MNTRTHDYYNVENFPTLVAHHGPWDIYRNQNNYCAAIPVDISSGHQASHFGDMSHVMVMVRNKYLALTQPAKP